MSNAPIERIVREINGVWVVDFIGHGATMFIPQPAKRKRKKKSGGE